MVECCSAAWRSHQREKLYNYIPVLWTRRIPPVILDIWRACCLSFLSCVGFMAQVMSKAPHVLLLLLLFKWPICSHHNLILVTTHVFLVRPWVCHYKNVHVRCVKEMFPYLCPPSFSCTITHGVLMVWAMCSECGKVAFTCSHVIFHLHRSPYVIFPPARTLNVARDGLTGCSCFRPEAEL